MMLSNKYKLEILKEVKTYYPNASIELNYDSEFQLLLAVMLSAQTTDKNVNKVTKELFEKYPDAKNLKKAKYEDLSKLIRPLGLVKAKTNNTIKLAKIFDEELNNIMPNTREELQKLPGVGIKTASAVLSNLYSMNYIAVDTHVNRVCIRLKIVKKDSKPEETMKKIERILINEDMNQYHHSLLFFGRYFCLAKNPKCKDCTLKNKCRYYKENK